MEEFEWLLNKKEKEIIKSIEVYLGLNNLDLDICDKINSVLQEEAEIYRYVYRKDSATLVIEYAFNFFGLDSIYLAYKIGSLESIKTFYNIEEFRDFLLEIL